MKKCGKKHGNCGKSYNVLTSDVNGHVVDRAIERQTIVDLTRPCWTPAMEGCASAAANRLPGDGYPSFEEQESRVLFDD